MTTRSIAMPMRISPAKVILWSLLALAIVLAVIRFTYGMGAISNLNNAYSFGLWISLDLLCGVALAAGGFTTCAAVYIFGLKQFKPLVRPAVLTAWLGYLAVIVALMVDLGRPERIWHMIIYWNAHSPLFEVGLCVMTYTTVLTLEFIPMLLEKLGWQKLENAIHKISLGLMILGVWLSTLHQSSLGSLFLVMADKVHPLWHSPLLPVFFFISAAFVGVSMVVFEGTIATKVYNLPSEVHLFSRLTKVLPWILGLYLVLKFGELTYNGDLHYAFEPSFATTMFWIEILGGVVLPLILFSLPAVRNSGRGVFLSAALVIAGLMTNRFNVGLLHWVRPVGSSYTPHWMEFALSIGVISALILAYDWVARNLKLFHHEPDHAHH
ncbi:MAG TPA: Ni/Fe-hydrogenase cytochrome b subunit [Symbiobacteriaceae bacterium]|nr:Ni/Fe-hydrogenase cytochrome b subunit [Symbiobacteriaceae bacterium]